MKYTLWNGAKVGLFCWILLLGSMVFFSLVPGSGQSPGEAIHLDKIFHFTTSCLASMLPLIFISSRRPAIFCAALIPVLGFGLEYLQRGVTGRTFSPEDLIANNLGVVFGVIIGCGCRIYRRYKRKGGKK